MRDLPMGRRRHRALKAAIGTLVVVVGGWVAMVAAWCRRYDDTLFYE